jgi:hypothetical protein
VFRFRTLLYTALLLIITTIAGVSLYLRNPLKVNVMRDRSTLAREAEPGQIENVYRLQVMNTDGTPRQYTVTAVGLKGLKVIGVDQPLRLGAESSQMVPLSLQAPIDDDDDEGKQKKGGRDDDGKNKRSHKVEIVVEAIGDPKVARREATSFLFPR